VPRRREEPQTNDHSSEQLPTPLAESSFQHGG
jgi:hypothetical protein